MRTGIFALVLGLSGALALTAVSCGGTTNNNTGGDGGVKLDGGGGDGSASTDMATAPKMGCNGYIDCLDEEYQNNGGDFDAAEATCKKRTKSTAVQKWETAVGCGQAYCLGAIDGGVNKCKLNATQDRLVNQDGSAPNDGTPCGDCLADALAGVFKGACKNATSPDCNPAACQTALNACLNDMP
jgi:hypothetical protein